ncbi:MAG: DUF2680 domain-containing protein [Peptococcaceae bacterium]|nr:YckD family protein [Peptococcaceae bacterium]MDH7525904.1 DUF2680 domain-containing protein [Peptococcaceae bacterium]
MKKALIILLALALIAGTASFALADENDSAKQPFKGRGNGFANCPQLQITDEQKAQMASLHKQMLELKKQIIQQNVTSGVLTQEQADTMIERIDKQIEAVNSGNVFPMGRQGFMGKGFRGFKQKTQEQAQ